MEPLSLVEIAGSCGGSLRRGDPSRRVRRVCTDSRKAGPGDVFFALRGERFDGHHYLPQVATGGAEAAIVEDGVKIDAPESLPLIEVPRTREALGLFAGWWREKCSPVCIAVAGSNGKTSTKEMAGAIFKNAGRTVMSPESFNNDLGVPLTLLELNPSSEFAVVEVGSNHPGELKPLLELIRPTGGILTGIGAEHLEFFKDLDGVFLEESTLASFIKPDGFLIVPSSVYRLDDLKRLSRGKVITAGLDESADWCGCELQIGWEGTRFEVTGPDSRFCGTYQIPQLGRDQAANAMLTIAMAAAVNIDPDAVRKGLQQAPRAKMRLEPTMVGEVQVLNDAYNSNPDSVRSALSLLRALPGAGRRVAVLGDMGELGEASKQAHLRVGSLVASTEVDHFLGVGTAMKEAVQQASLEGCRKAEWVSNTEAAGNWLCDKTGSGDMVLLKGSRFMRMEAALARFQLGMAGTSKGGGAN